MSSRRWSDMDEYDHADDFTNDFEIEEAAPVEQASERETDPHRIAQRQKQVDLGKNTLGYQKYRKDIPKESRGKRHPQTPDAYQVCSKRAFDGQIRKWRRALHEWDTASNLEERFSEEVAPTPAEAKQHASKNGQAWRPTNNSNPAAKLTAFKNNNKRSYATIAAVASNKMNQAGNLAVAPVQNDNTHTVATTAATALFSPPTQPEAKQAKTDGASRFYAAMEMQKSASVNEVEMVDDDVALDYAEEGHVDDMELQPMKLVV